MQTSATPLEASIEKVHTLVAGIKVPQHCDKVFKDECAFSFDTPFSDGGLCVNLKSWIGFAADMVDLDIQRSGGTSGLYLVQKFKRVPKEGLPTREGTEAPSKLGIGVAGGFLEEKWEVAKEHSLLVIDVKGEKTTVPLPCVDLPMIVTQACDAIIAHQGAGAMDATNRWEDDQDLRESKYAKDLVQLPAAKKISPHPKDWKCKKSGDTQNLWLNLSDGQIGGGRRFWDGTGGSNGALDHFNEEKERGNFYPLVVKLGTITPQGADVYSYAPDEDRMVKDPLLAQHLEHWGIDVMKMEKTDKSLAEMEVDLNLHYDWSRICECGDKPLQRLRGPGLVGLKNLGNSCYMNSTVQLLMTLPEAKSRYFDADREIRRKAPSDAPTDLITQVAKLVNGLLSERYAPPLKGGDDEDDPRVLVAPQMFRSLIGRQHPEFSSGRQQDAGEFLQYLLEQMSRAERTALGSRLGGSRPFASLFEFALEQRIEESTGEKRVKYSRERQNVILLPVKLEDADNIAKVRAFRAAQAELGEKKARKPKAGGELEEPAPLIQLQAVLNRFTAPEDISFRGTTASKRMRIATMPRYLLVQVQRYYVDENWIPSKLDCKVPMPESLSLESLRGTGPQPGETALPEEAETAAPAVAPAGAGPEPDTTIVAQLVSLGLGENTARLLAANDPLPAVGGNGSGVGGTDSADPEAVSALSSMGFAEAHVKAALKTCGNNAERAADWLFSHADDLDSAVTALEGAGAGGGAAADGVGGGIPDYEDGPGEYSLVGFISHIGRNTSHGHYVCHMKRGVDRGWVIFDDHKVARSDSPPLELGYVYLYHRKDVTA